jgi:NhaP-type Na+/H+ or K+/H+ antiporter
MVVRASSETQSDVSITLSSLFLVLLMVVVVYVDKWKINGSIASIAIGTVLGALLWPTGLAEALDLDSHMAVFNRELFYYTLLPPIIFEAGFSLQKRPFFG